MVFCYLDDVVTACTFTIVFSWMNTASFAIVNQHPFSVHCIVKVKVVSFDVKFRHSIWQFVMTLLLLFSICAIPVTYLLNYRTHSKDITSVTFHRKYPLFASSSEDCTAYVCHGMVYSDLNQNPLIVPLEILRGHSSSDGRGMHGIGSIIFTILI